MMHVFMMRHICHAWTNLDPDAYIHYACMHDVYIHMLLDHYAYVLDALMYDAYIHDP